MLSVRDRGVDFLSYSEGPHIHSSTALIYSAISRHNSLYSVPDYNKTTISVCLHSRHLGLHSLRHIQRCSHLLYLSHFSPFIFWLPVMNSKRFDQMINFESKLMLNMVLWPGEKECSGRVKLLHFTHTDPVARLESFRALKLSRFESFSALKC